MTEEELKAWKIKKKTEAYEEYVGSPDNSWDIDLYTARLKAIDAIV